MTRITNRKQAQDALKEFARLKATVAELEAERKAQQAALCDYFDRVKDDSISVDVNGVTVRGTVVRASTVDINVPRLKKAVGSKVWNKVTVRVLDKGLLEERIADGTVDPMVVAECSEEKPKSPYIKLTESKKSEKKSLRDLAKTETT